MARSRQLWADYTKAFAIWLMVLCHFGLRPEGLVQFIYIFHMPVFFLVSGYFDKGTPFSGELVKKNFKRIIIPYFFFNVCSFSICWISPYIHPELYNNGTIPQTFLKAFVGMFLGEDMVRPYAFMPTGALWFLIALFNCRILFSLLCFCWEKCKLAILAILALCVVAVCYRFAFFSLDSAIISLPFYVGGYLMKKYNVMELLQNKGLILILAISCWIYTALIGTLNGEINMDGCVWGQSLIMFYINGIIGSLACIFTFHVLNYENRYLQEIGASTLTILGTHGYINKFSTIAAVLVMGCSPSNIPLWYIVTFSILALFFGVWVERLLTRYCPTMIGKSAK